MSIFGEFRVPTEALALEDTFAAEPEAVVEIDRVVAAEEEHLTPYVLVSGVTSEAFEAAVSTDDSVEGLRHLYETDAATLYKADWRDDVEALAHEYTRRGASILTAKGHADGWHLRMRFDDRPTIQAFTDQLRERDYAFELLRLHEQSYARAGSKFGLTPKQHEALVTAWELGYFDLPREVSMAEVADEIGITAQSFSDRLRRAQHALIADTLRVAVPVGRDDGLDG